MQVSELPLEQYEAIIALREQRKAREFLDNTLKNIVVKEIDNNWRLVFDILTSKNK